MAAWAVGKTSRKGGDAMEVYQALTLMISFASLVVSILSFHKRK